MKIQALLTDVTPKQITVEDIARICHEAHRLFNEAADAESQTFWEDTSQEMKEQVIAGVRAVIDYPEVTAEQAYRDLFHAETKKLMRTGCISSLLLWLQTLSPRQLLWCNLFRDIVQALQPRLPVIEGDRITIQLKFAPICLGRTTVEYVGGKPCLQMHSFAIHTNLPGIPVTYFNLDN